MKKTKGKVLSLILASAMIVSSFSSMMGASAAPSRESGKLSFTDADGKKVEKLYLASNLKDGTNNRTDKLEDLLGNVELKTYDNEVVSGAEFVSYTHASGDRLIRSIKGDDDDVTLRSDAQGKEVITVYFEGEYDRDDKTVKVRGKQDITIYADPVGSQFVAKESKFEATAEADYLSKRPDDYDSAAVNQEALVVGIYEVKDAGDGLAAKYAPVAEKTVTAKTESTKAFTIKKKQTRESDSKGNVTIETAYNEDDSVLAKTGTITLEANLATKVGKNSDKTFKVSVAKKWKIDRPTGAEVNKKSGSTYVTKDTGTVDWDDWKAEDKANAQNVTGYDLSLADGTNLIVKNGKVGNISGGDFNEVTVEGGSTGDIKANKISIEDGTVGTLKGRDTENAEIDITDGRVKAIDAENAIVKIDGGVVSGDVVGDNVTIDAGDEDIATTVSGNVTAKGDEAKVDIKSSSEAAVKVTGTIKGQVSLADNVVVGTVDADYDYSVTFTGFTGSIEAIINNPIEVTLEDESTVALKGKLVSDSINIEDEDSKLIIGEGRFGSVEGDGTLAVPANKLFIEDSIDDVTLQLTQDLAVNETAFQAYADQVDIEDFTALGYTLERKAVNDDVDKFVIKSVTFAGVSFDKTELSIAKGYSDTITVGSYPNGTALPKDATVEWSVDANDDYITVTTEGNTATIQVLDYNSDYATDNQATITATVVDANGVEYDEYVAATAKVSAIAVPVSEVTLDTNKPITLGTGSVYQYIAKSSTGAVLSAASSDAQVATVELFNAADARGYKFQINAIAEGKAVITTTDANGASKAIEVTVTKVNGSLKADTTSYTFAPGAIYDVKFTVNGSTEVPVVSVNGKVVSIAPRGNGVYRVTAQNPGTAYVVAKAGNTHVSVKFDVVAGATAKGVTGNNVSLFK